MSGEHVIRYRPGRTSALFHASNAFVRGLRGPIGSGKSVTCVMEMFRIAALQRKGPDGKRRTRWAAIRNTYPELKSTTIRTFLDWFPDSICKITYGSPITAVVTVNDIVMEVWFIALDTPGDVKKLKSLELTGVFINEASEISKAVLDMATGRVGRYPSKKDGGSRWSGVIMDTNPPDTDHWWYQLAEVTKPKDWEFFAQPPALIKHSDGSYSPNPAAENIENHELGFDYYLRQIEGKKEEWIKVFILGEYGAVMDGKPVYPEYRDSVHCAPGIIEALGGVPLILGWDFGRTPAAVVCQATPRGQFRVLREFLVDADGPGMGLRMFAREVVAPGLAQYFPGVPIGASFGDPAGSAKDNHDLDCFDVLGAEGIPSEKAPTNMVEARLDAVRKPLMTMIDGEPGFLISGEGAPVIRKGFLGGYRYARMQVTGEERYRDVPDKNKYSHPHDALQYAAFAPGQTNIVVPRTVARPVRPVSARGWT